jgi:diguanylate cyclase (GGDEF)-like protein
LVWLHVSALPEVKGDLDCLLGLYERLGQILDVALCSSIDAFVEESTRVLARRATRDVITGLPNRGAFEETLQREIDAAEREGIPLSLLLIDLDKFKDVNDTLGHLEGDNVLMAVARALESSVRITDLAARLGGDEFGVVLPGTAQGTAMTVAERVTHTVSNDPWLSSLSVQVRASVGVGWLPNPESATQLMAVTDLALYRAKRAGGDRAEPVTELDVARVRVPMASVARA